MTGAPPSDAQATTTSPADAPRRLVAGNEDWIELVAGGGLSGPVLQLASHAAFVGDDGDTLRLGLAPADELLRRPALVAQLGEALGPLLGGQPTVRIDTMAAGETPRQRTERERDVRQLAAEEAFKSDPQVQQLIGQHGAKLVPDSIRPFDDA